MSRGFYVAISVALIVGFVVIGLLWTQKRKDEEEEARDGAYIPRQAVITPEIELLRRYIRIDTSNPPGQERAAADFLIEELAKSGVRAELIQSAPGRANVYARLRGRQQGEGLLLLHHMDVVPAEGKDWKYPPFEARVELNMVWGRGTLDMKSVGMCELLAFAAVAKSGKQPRHDLVFLATADEEKGSELGTGWLMKNRPDVFEGVRYALNEGGITEVVRERLTYFGIEIGSKQLVRMRLRSHHKQALDLARIRLEPRFNPSDPDRIMAEIPGYFRAIAPRRKEGGEILRDVNLAVSEGKFWSLAGPYRALTQNNLFAAGVEKEGDGYGMTIYLQNLPDEDPSRQIQLVRERVLDSRIEVEVQQVMGPTRISSTTTPFYGHLMNAVKSHYGEQVSTGPVILPQATTDCRYLRSREIDCYGIWPFPVDFFQSTGIHGLDERIRLDWFMQGVSLTRKLVLTYAGI